MERNLLRWITVAVFAVAVALFAWTAAANAIELEEGATFDGGVCWESDGTEGIAMFDGECMTPADYDAIYSVEALSAVASHVDPTRSIAEVYGLTDTATPASERPRTFMGESLDTFAGYVGRLHGAANMAV